jgi:hypothetical protein
MRVCAFSLFVVMLLACSAGGQTESETVTSQQTASNSETYRDTLKMIKAFLDTDDLGRLFAVGNARIPDLLAACRETDDETAATAFFTLNCWESPIVKHVRILYGRSTRDCSSLAAQASGTPISIALSEIWLSESPAMVTAAATTERVCSSTIRSFTQVLARTGGRILLEVSYRCGILCGRGHSVVLRSDGNVWQYAVIRMAYLPGSHAWPFAS